MAEPESPALTPEQVSRLVSAVAAWVERHPAPEYRAFAFADNAPFSPRELLNALQEGGPSARQFLRMTQFALEDESFDGLVAQFEGRFTAR